MYNQSFTPKRMKRNAVFEAIDYKILRFRRKLRIGPQRRFKLFFSLSMILETDKKIMSSDSLALWF